MNKAIFKLFRLGLIAAVVLLFPIALSSADRSKKTPAAQGPQSAGEKIFHSNCAMCHNADSTKDKLGPGLQGLFKNKELPKSHKPATEENVRTQIEKGSPHAKPMGMPAFKGKLTPSQIDDLIAYLKTL
ncbi:MAG: cytochrome c [Acidobacteriia bacterium]|nr:cytochrome c [Terriglobia bacterium]